LLGFGIVDHSLAGAVRGRAERVHKAPRDGAIGRPSRGTLQRLVDSLSGPLRHADRSKIDSPLAGPAVRKNMRA